MKLNANVDHFESEKYESYINDLINTFGAKQLENLRIYLTILSHLDYKLTNAMQKVKLSLFSIQNIHLIKNNYFFFKLVEDDIVQLRQNHLAGSNNALKEKMSIDDFHLLLVVAR